MKWRRVFLKTAPAALYFTAQKYDRACTEVDKRVRL